MQMAQVSQAAAYIQKQIKTAPQVAIILGTGLGAFADLLKNPVIIPYGDIPHFPVSTAPYHKGQLLAGVLGNKPVIVLQGRVHYYEGYSMEEVAFPVRVLKLLGVKTLFVTNACGAINTNFQVGDLMVMTDHIKFFNDSPLRGENIDQFGPRFNDMTNAYTKRLRDLAATLVEKQQIPLKFGVYAYMPGPSYETPAEIRMLGTLGADVVGMSTVPEVLTAAHAGMEIFGLSFCVNMAAGLCPEIKHLGFSPIAIDRFKTLLCAMLEEL